MFMVLIHVRMHTAALVLQTQFYWIERLPQGNASRNNALWLLYAELLQELYGSTVRCNIDWTVYKLLMLRGCLQLLRHHTLKR